MSLQKIGFIGLGLIGGSIAKKLHALHPELTMIATAHHAETVAEAYKEHLIINNTPCELKDFADCDYIFLCTPTKKNIEYLHVIRLGRFIKIRVKANAFLYHMVRNIVGCLVYVGTGARSVDWMGEVLEAKSRQAAAPTFYPTGLYLTGVGYPEIFGLPQHGASPFPG